MTHSLRTYREALSSWLRRQRAALSVAECEPAVLDLARARYDPCLVICEAPTPAMRHEAASLSWIEFHPAGSSVSVVHLPGEDRQISNLALDDVLDIVDAAHRDSMFDMDPPAGASSA